MGKETKRMKRAIFSVLPVLLATAFTAASAYTLNGTVNDDTGSPVSGALAKLLVKGDTATTDSNGKFTFHEDDPLGLSAGAFKPGHIDIVDGVLRFSQSSNAPVQVRIFDMMGNLVLRQELHGSGQVDLRQGVTSQGAYYARVHVGNAVETVRFTSDGSHVSNAIRQGGHKALLKPGEGDTLRIIAEGFDTLNVALPNLDTTIALQLTKVSSEETLAFGWAKGNAPVPSSGCGKDTQLSKSGQFKFSWTYKGENTERDVYYDLPNNYDKNKPYRLVFGMQCMNGSAQNVARNENYYGMKPLDKDGSTIFVAPDGKCHSDNCLPWEEKDYAFFDELLAKLESELCIDSSRVFSSGFSYGSMFTNGLSRNHQHVLRAVAVYETADKNIWLPDVVNKPIAWMGVHGLSDNLCTPAMGRSARDTALKNASAEGKDATKEKAEESNSSQHKCYDYKDVDERFPVKWCTDNAGHQWDHRDPGQQQSWVPQTTWEFFTQF